MIKELLKSEEIHEKIIAVIKFARENVITTEDMLVAQANGTAVGSVEDRVLEFGDGYRVVFSIEDQPIGLSKHISVSKDHVKPPLEDLMALLDVFGFRYNGTNKNQIAEAYLESYTIEDDEINDGYREAVNVIELDEEEFNEWFEDEED